LLYALTECSFHLWGKSRATEQVTDPQGSVPQLLPTHVAEIFAAQLQANPFAQGGGVHKQTVGFGEDANPLWDREIVLQQMSQRISLAPGQGEVLALYLFKIEAEGHDRINSSTF
jgi:hypothetical protein